MARYSYGTLGFAPVATPTDILVLKGPSNKESRLRKFRMSGLATTAGLIPVTLLKRTTANTAGTLTNPAAGKREKNAPTAESILSLYTANPSGLGTAGEIFFTDRLWLNLIGGFRDKIRENWTYDEAPQILAGEFLAVNLGGAALPAGAAVDIFFEIEER